MYAYKTFGRRRPEGWVERRRYFRRLIETTGGKTERAPAPESSEPSPRR